MTKKLNETAVTFSPRAIEKTESPLAVIHRSWIDAGAVTPSARRVAAFKKRIRDAAKRTDQLAAMTASARIVEREIAREVMTELGSKVSLLIDGVVYEPACRGNEVYYRPLPKTPRGAL